MNVCTIIAKNYVAHARVLARSLADTNPQSRLWVLIIDDFSGHIDPDGEPFSVLTPGQIGCDPFLDMALRYSVLELSTAVKPWLLRHLMGETGEPVTYLDPDIQIHGSLQRLDELAARHGVVLTPHNSAPIPQDGRKPSQVDIMIAGIYNLGYVSLAARPEVDQLLDWWAQRLRRDCRVDPIWGYFVDQRWFDLAPGFLSDLAIVRDPEYNVAYWNLHDRRLERGGGGYTVNDRPLAFFHFSGFDPEQPLVLSRHQNRIDVAQSPPLEGILAEYAAAVLEAGHAASRHWPYEFQALGDGTPVDDTVRVLYDQYAAEHPGPVASPFSLDGAISFEHWLREPVAHGPAGISRALAHVYEDRADVRGAFPDLDGPDRDSFLSWAAAAGAAQEPLLARVHENGGAAAGRHPGTVTGPVAAASAGPQPNPPAAGLRDGPWGVNLVGRLQDAGESGEVARGVLSALDAAQVRALPVPYPGQITRASLPVNLICLGPEILPDYVKAAGASQFAGRYSVGLWLWPVELFDEAWQSRISLLEEVWVPSAHVAAALSGVSTVPVRIVPLAVEARARAAVGGDADLGTRIDPGPFVFAARHDHREDFERQNTLGVIEAFTRAFHADSGPRLVIESIGPGPGPGRHAELDQAAAGRDDIEVSELGGEEPSGAGAVNGDCFVSLHRATAFGTAIAQAMAMGKPVIASGYSGNLEFMSSDNSHLVAHRLVAIGAGHDPYPQQARWAEPDLDHAAALMRKVFEDPGGAAALGSAGAQSIRATHSPSVAGAVMARRLESIRATGVAKRGPDAVLEQPATLSRLPLRLAQGPFPAAPGAGQATRERLRRAVLSVMKPFTRYQQVVNAELVAAIADLHAEIERQHTRADAERADRLGQARRDAELHAELRALTARLADLQNQLNRR